MIVVVDPLWLVALGSMMHGVRCLFLLGSTDVEVSCDEHQILSEEYLRHTVLFGRRASEWERDYIQARYTVLRELNRDSVDELCNTTLFVGSTPSIKNRSSRHSMYVPTSWLKELQSWVSKNEVVRLFYGSWVNALLWTDMKAGLVPSNVVSLFEGMPTVEGKSRLVVAPQGSVSEVAIASFKHLVVLLEHHWDETSFYICNELR